MKLVQVVCLGRAELSCQELFPLGSVLVTEAWLKERMWGFLELWVL